jgi:hypothetical protein
MDVEHCSLCRGPIVGGVNRDDPVVGHFDGVAVGGPPHHADRAAALVEEMIPFDPESRRYGVGETFTDHKRKVVAAVAESSSTPS